MNDVFELKYLEKMEEKFHPEIFEQVKRAFNFMNEDLEVEEDIYDKNAINDFLDDDSITAEEQGFMIGFLAA